MGIMCKLSLVSSHFVFVFALSQFCGPDYLRAWKRLSEHNTQEKALSLVEPFASASDSDNLVFTKSSAT